MSTANQETQPASSAESLPLGQPVVHFEIVGREPAHLRAYYAALFGWRYNVEDAATTSVSDPGEYGFITADTTGEGGINGGVAGGPVFTPRVLFYVAVADVAEALTQAERLGGTRVMGPEPASGAFTVGHFLDPEGNLVGVAGPTATA